MEAFLPVIILVAILAVIALVIVASVSRERNKVAARREADKVTHQQYRDANRQSGDRTPDFTYVSSKDRPASFTSSANRPDNSVDQTNLVMGGVLAASLMDTPDATQTQEEQEPAQDPTPEPTPSYEAPTPSYDPSPSYDSGSSSSSSYDSGSSSSYDSGSSSGGGDF